MGVAGCIFTAIGLSMGWLYMVCPELTTVVGARATGTDNRAFLVVLRSSWAS